MRIFAISDFHGRTDLLPDLKNAVQEEDPDVIVFTGDIVKGHARGDEWLKAKSEGRKPRKTERIRKEEKEDKKFYNEFFSAIRKTGVPLVLIPGNMDSPKKRFDKEQDYGTSVHRERTKEGNLTFSGFGGQIGEKREDYFILQRPPHEVTVKKAKVLLFHQPPIGKVDLDDGEHKGHKKINSMIDDVDAMMVFCGHAHHAQGAQMIDKSLVINPGALKYKNYVLIDDKELEPEFKKL